MWCSHKKYTLTLTFVIDDSMKKGEKNAKKQK